VTELRQAKTTKVRVRDVVNEAIAGLVERPGRTVLTVLGSALGITALIASLGLSRTAGSQILVRLDKLQATAIDVRLRTGSAFAGDQVAPSSGIAEQPGIVEGVLPADSLQRVDRLNGVQSSAVLTRLEGRRPRVRASYVRDFEQQPSFDRDIIVASPTLLGPIGGKMKVGRMFDVGNSARADRVCVLGARTATALGISGLDGSPAVFLGEAGFSVVGILESVDRREDLLDAVIISEGSAVRFGYKGPSNIVIRTDLGAVETVSPQLPTVLAPSSPAQIDVRTGRQAQVVRQTTERDLDALFLGLGIVVSVIGALSIANMTLVSVYERVGEIGLRRSLGARPFHIAAQFLTESTVLGIFGGILGTTAGVLAIVGTAAIREWTPVLELGLVFAAPVAGAVVGLVSGLWPALRAARMEPVDALRRGT
jgi:MacB-like periplasmic core domain/FtsX-like permease family